MVVNHNGDHEWGRWDQAQGVIQSLVDETDCTQHAILQPVLKDRPIGHKTMVSQDMFLKEVLNRWLGTQKLSGVDRSAQTRQIHIKITTHTSAYCISESNLQSVI